MAKKSIRGSIGSYRKPGTARATFDPAGEILKGIEDVQLDVSERFKTVREFEDAAATRRQEMIDSVKEGEGMDDFSAVDSIQEGLMKQIDELYKLDIASFEGNRADFNKKRNQTQKVIGMIPTLMGLIDQEGEVLKDKELSGNFIKSFLASDNDEDYFNFIKNASRGGDKISFRIKDGDIIAQLNGKDVFSGNSYIKAKKDGFDLVNYAGDYTKELNAADAQAYKGLDDVVLTRIQQDLNSGSKLTETQIEDYTKAKKEYERRLRSGLIALPVNESTYQTFTNYGDKVVIDGRDKMQAMPFEGNDNQVKSTKDSMINFLINNRFPSGDQVTTKITEKSGALLSQYQKRVLSDKDKQRKLVEKMDQELKDSLKTDLNRNVKHAREAYYGAKGELGSEERANFISNVLNEAGADTNVEKEDGVYKVFDEAGEVKGLDTFKGLVDLLNKLTIFDITDADKPLSQKDVNARDIYVKTYVAGAINEMGEIEQVYKPRNEEEQKAAIEQMKPGDAIITIDGQFMRKPKGNADNASRFNK